MTPTCCILKSFSKRGGFRCPDIHRFPEILAVPPLPVVWDDETQNWKIYTGVLTGVVDEGDILEEAD